MTVELPKIYPITNAVLSGLSHSHQVEMFAAAGAKLVQLREKHLSPRDFIDDARGALSIGRRNGVKIIINDRVDIALAIGADGVHLGQDDLPPAGARELLGPSAIIGFSTHSRAQAVEAASLPVDYIAIGPAFPTSTKENPDDVVGMNGISAVRSAIGSFPLVAIGGIDAANIGSVLEAGADSAAVIKALFDPARTIPQNYALLVNSVGA